MSKCQLIQGDCLVEMDKLIDEGVKVDMVLTDPPYGTTACKWDSIISFDKMWDCIDKITYNTTPILLFGSEPYSSNLRMSNIKNYRYDWIWHKTSSGDFALANKRPMKFHEIISVFYKNQPKYFPQFQDYSDGTKTRHKEGEFVNRKAQLKKSTNNLQNGLSLEGRTPISFERGKFPESVQFFKSIVNSAKERVHPTQKPVKLLGYLIRTYTNENDLVLDFTMGSGSTGVACLQTNRNFIGIELEPKYYEIAKERCSNYQSKLW